jgi:Ca-activated chloride channel family protein
MFRETRNGEDYLLAVVNPPAMKVEGQRRDRETIFVIDNSGSMSGESMDQAKVGLLLALDRLAPSDEFNIIRFDDTMEHAVPTAVARQRAEPRASEALRVFESGGEWRDGDAARAAGGAGG